MRVVRDDLWLCSDCTIAAVNGDFTGLDYHYSEPEASKRMAAIEAGLEALGPHLVSDFDSETGDGIREFMRAPVRGCACCGSNLSGEFHRFAVLGEGHETNPKRRRQPMRKMQNNNSEEIPIANDPSDGKYQAGEGPLFRFGFGAYGDTHVYVWADHLEDALEIALEWLDDNAPGLLTNLGLEAYKEAADDEGIKWNDDWPDFDDADFQRVVEAAEADMTMVSHTTLKHGNAIPSYEWTADEITDGEEYDAVLVRCAPYTYRMAYEIITPESAEDGDAAERGWEVEEPAGPFSLEDLVREVNDKNWVEWSSSNPTGRDWLISEGEQDYSTGAETQYSLFIKRVDDKPLSTEEIKDISKALGVSTFGMMMRNAGKPSLQVDWDRMGRGPMKVVGPAYRMGPSGYEKISDRVTLSRPRQAGHEIEGRVKIGGKSYSAFTSGGENPDGGDGMIIVRKG